MRGMSTRGGLVVALLLALATAARADDVAHARDAARKAVQHYNLAEWQQALDSFTEAYRAHEDPAFLFNIAQCHRLLGHNREALATTNVYAGVIADPQNRAEVEKRIDVKSSWFRLRTNIRIGTAEFVLYSVLFREPGNKVRTVQRSFGSE